MFKKKLKISETEAFYMSDGEYLCITGQIRMLNIVLNSLILS